MQRPRELLSTEKHFFTPPHRDLSVWTKHVFPLLRRAIGTGYFSLETKGLENIPKKGQVIYVLNHSGWFTLDSFFFAYALTQAIPAQRIPYAIVHDLVLKFPLLKQIFSNKGVIPASWLRTPERIPSSIESFGFYPEGEQGNCKPFWQAYRMKLWKTGFVRLAMIRHAKVVPVAVMGGEESCPVAWPLDLFRSLIGAPIPIPIVPFPLPTRWKFVFDKPIDFRNFSKKNAEDRKQCLAIASQIQGQLQDTLDWETQDRPLARLSAWVARYIPTVQL